MADAVELVRFVNKDDLPEELSRFDGLGRDEKKQFVGFDETGNPAAPIRNIGDVLIKTLVELKVAEEVTDNPEAKISRLEERVKELEERLQKAEGKAIGKTDNSKKFEITPEVQKAIDTAVQEQTAELKTRLDNLESENQNLQQLIKKLENEKKDLEEKNKELERRLAKNSGGSSENQKMVAGFNRGDDVAVKRGDRGYERGYIVIGFDQDDAGNDRIILIDKLTGKEVAVYPRFLKKVDEIEQKELLPPSRRRQPAEPARRVERKENFVSKLRRRITNEAPPPPLYRDNVAYFYHKDGEEIIVPDNEVERDRNRWAAIGAAALAFLILAQIHHEMEELENRQAKPVYVKPIVVQPRIVTPKIVSPKIIVPPGTTTEGSDNDSGTTTPGTTTESGTPAPGTTTTETTPDNDSSSGVAPSSSEPSEIEKEGFQISFYNGPDGNRGFGVYLSKELDLRRSNSVKPYYSIFDTRLGRLVVKRVSWDEQGNLSADTRAAIRSWGDYEVEQGPMDFKSPNSKFRQHYITAVDSSVS